MAEKVTKWQTSDGHTFDTEQLANIYEDRYDIIKLVDNEPMQTHGRAEIDGQYLLQYIDAHPRLMLVYLTELPKDGN